MHTMEIVVAMSHFQSAFMSTESVQFIRMRTLFHCAELFMRLPGGIRSNHVNASRVTTQNKINPNTNEMLCLLAL